MTEVVGFSSPQSIGTESFGVGTIIRISSKEDF
jgi:hypothetical protein